jgi:thiol-disulfide isomerase/thioredoxin
MFRRSIGTTYNPLMIKNFASALTLSALLAGCSPAPQSAQSVLPVMTAPMVDLAGQPTSLAAYRGRPLVINFWARWCDPCRREIPDLVAERRRLHSRGVELVGVALESDAAGVREFAVAQGIDYPIVLAGEDGGLSLMQGMGNTNGGLPYTVALDGKGGIRATKLGAMNRREIVMAFEAALD